MQSFPLPPLMNREPQIERICKYLRGLSMADWYDLDIKKRVRKRTNPQNNYLWGVAYPAIMKHLPGWDADDVHEYCLGECFGWERLGGLGRAKLKPVKRSSKLSVTEFMDYVAWIQRDMAGRGIYVPDPNEEAVAA